MEKKTSSGNELGGSYFYVRFSCSDEVFVAADHWFLVIFGKYSFPKDSWEKG